MSIALSRPSRYSAKLSFNVEPDLFTTGNEETNERVASDEDDEEEGAVEEATLGVVAEEEDGEAPDVEDAVSGWS